MRAPKGDSECFFHKALFFTTQQNMQKFVVGKSQGRKVKTPTRFCSPKQMWYSCRGCTFFIQQGYEIPSLNILKWTTPLYVILIWNNGPHILAPYFMMSRGSLLHRIIPGFFCHCWIIYPRFHSLWRKSWEVKDGFGSDTHHNRAWGDQGLFYPPEKWS